MYGHHFDDCCAGVLDPNPDPNPKGLQVYGLPDPDPLVIGMD